MHLLEQVQVQVDKMKTSNKHIPVKIRCDKRMKTRLQVRVERAEREQQAIKVEQVKEYKKSHPYDSCFLCFSKFYHTEVMKKAEQAAIFEEACEDSNIMDVEDMLKNQDKMFGLFGEPFLDKRMYPDLFEYGRAWYLVHEVL